MNLVRKSIDLLKMIWDAIITVQIAEKVSLKRYLELVERCTSTRLREVIWELIESKWGHIGQWRNAHKAIREKNVSLHTDYCTNEKCTCPVPCSL